METKLLKIIEHAEKNGFDFCSWIWKNTTIPLLGMMEGNVKELIRTNYYKLLLLDREFAQRFFYLEDNGLWFENLQAVILESDLISYYAKFLEENNVS
jgi:hypothetical protein